MKVDFFKPEDFYSRNYIQEYIGSLVSGKVVNCGDAAAIANKLLEERGVIVQCADEEIERDASEWRQKRYPYDRHRALLINIKKLPKECAHEPDRRVIGDIDYSSERNNLRLVDEATCKHCGIKMKAKWEVEE